MTMTVVVMCDMSRAVYMCPSYDFIQLPVYMTIWATFNKSK